MQRGHVAPIGTLALAATLALGSMLVAPEAHAEPVHESGRQSKVRVQPDGGLAVERVPGA